MTVNMQLLYLFRKHIGKKVRIATYIAIVFNPGLLATHVGKIRETLGSLRVKRKQKMHKTHYINGSSAAKQCYKMYCNVLT